MSVPILGAGLPAVTDQAWYMIISPKRDLREKVIALAQTFTGVWVHWQGAAVACDGTVNCPRCRPGGPPIRWQGYLPCYDRIHRRYAVLALSEGAARSLEPLLEEFGTLRGMPLESRRKVAHQPNSAQLVYKTGAVITDGCPPNFDIWPSLRRLWGLNDAFVQRTAAQAVATGIGAEGEGITLPREHPPEEARATAEQRERLKEILGGWGEMPGG